MIAIGSDRREIKGLRQIASDIEFEESGAVWRLQLIVLLVFLMLCGAIVGLLYAKDREREWRLREEQATHRLELCYELITRDLRRVRSDILLIANRTAMQDFVSGDARSRTKVETEFADYLRFKSQFQQIRLVDLDGREVAHVNSKNDRSKLCPAKAPGQKGPLLHPAVVWAQPGEVFVSDFDLNQELGEIEKPLMPVIRFITPVVAAAGQSQFLLVLNYRGQPLLRELATVSCRVRTYLIREDGHYLLGPSADHAWGWLLKHARSFEFDFPTAWQNRRTSLSIAF